MHQKSRAAGARTTVLFDFTFVHLFPAAAVASGNCELSEHSALIEVYFKRSYD